MTDYRSISMWHDTAGDDFVPRPALPGPVEVDVAIVGAGYTGLWTAYYLKKADPGVRVIIVEREIAGFGASGRNGGWCSQLFASPRERLAAVAGRKAAAAMQGAMFETVAEVGRATAAEGIECDFLKGGNLIFATNQAQAGRLREEAAYERAWGFGPEDSLWLTASEAADRIAVGGVLGALYSPHCARVHPTKLARGLARVVEGMGVPIYEHTPAVELGPGSVRTPGGIVKADVVVRATESFTVDLPGLRRALVPIYSLMIATEPLPAEIWSEIGWEGRECWSDGRNLIIYVCRTADDRIAMGGRGAPYHFGSRIQPGFERDDRVAERLRITLGELLPPVRDAAITHHWGGPVALPRDWHTSVGYDREAGIAWASGYIGDGVSTANLAGRTLADLMMGTESDLVELPWVGHVSPEWEPEPLRWLGVNLSLRMMASADRAEERSGRPSRRAALTARLVGR